MAATNKAKIAQKKVMQRLHDEHAYLFKLRNAMNTELNRVSKRSDPDLMVLRDMFKYLMEYPDTHHHPLEDQIFSRLIEKGTEHRSDALELLAEHKDLARESQYLFHHLDAMVHGDERCNRSLLKATVHDYLELYAEHVRREESVLFPAAIEELSAEDWIDIEETLENVDDPLFADLHLPDFAELRERIEENMDTAASGLAMGEMMGFYALIEVAGALSEGVSELHRINVQQLGAYRDENLKAIRGAKSATDAVSSMLSVNSRLIGQGFRKRALLARNTWRAAYLPCAESLRTVRDIVD